MVPALRLPSEIEAREARGTIDNISRAPSVSKWTIAITTFILKAILYSIPTCVGMATVALWIRRDVRVALYYTPSVSMDGRGVLVCLTPQRNYLL